MGSSIINENDKNLDFKQTLYSWGKILTFYVCFYIFLFSFWYLMLIIFLETVHKDRPNWAYTESLLKMSPGLAFRPRIPFDKADSSIMIYNLNDTKSHEFWIEDLNRFLKPYKHIKNKFLETDHQCKSAHLRHKDCPFLPDFDQEQNHCNLEDFGFGSGEPCFLIKLNRIYFWEPSPYRSQEELPKGVNAGDVDLEEGKGLIFIECKGETDFDQKSFEKITYWPYQGFPAEKYPYKGQENYTSPFVLARLRNVRKNVPISIECTTYDKNIKIRKSEKIGYFQFEIIIESERPLSEI